MADTRDPARAQQPDRGYQQPRAPCDQWITNGFAFVKALHAIEEGNLGKLRDVFQDISFNSNKLGDEQQKNDILRHLLEDFAKPELNLRESRVGQLDVIGNAYEFLIKNFASTSGKKAGEFYTPPEVSTLMARLMFHLQSALKMK